METLSQVQQRVRPLRPPVVLSRTNDRFSGQVQLIDAIQLFYLPNPGKTQVFVPLTKSADIGEKLGPQHVVFDAAELSNPVYTERLAAEQPRVHLGQTGNFLSGGKLEFG